MALDDKNNFAPDYALADKSPDWFEFGHTETDKSGKEIIVKKKSTEYGIFCDTPQPPPMGKIRYSRTAVPYRQDVIRNTNSRDDISYTLNCYTFQDGKDFRINKIYELVKDAERLYTSRYDGYYYKINEIDGITPKADANGLRINYSIKLSLDPYKYFDEGKEVEFGTTSFKRVFVDGDIEAEPIVTFTANKGDVAELLGDVDGDGHITVTDYELLTMYISYLEKKARMDELKKKIEAAGSQYSGIKVQISSWKSTKDYEKWYQEESKKADTGKSPIPLYFQEVSDYIDWFNNKGEEVEKAKRDLTEKQKQAADVNQDGKIDDWYYHDGDQNHNLGQKYETGKRLGFKYIASPDTIAIQKMYSNIQTGQGNDYSVSSPRQATISAGGVKMTIGLPAHAINIGAQVTLDVGQKRLYYVNEKGIKENILQYSEGDFPILYPGNNTVAWSGEISDVKIRWQERWI